MAATRTCEKATCPFCEKSRRAYELPAHMLSVHTTSIRIGAFNNGHCVYATAGPAMDFCVCLTCKKGFVGDGSEPNQQRWITMHGKSAECRAAHAAALVAIRQATGAPAPAPTPQPQPIQSSIDALWDECKVDTRLRPVMTEVEEFCREMDDVFDVKEGVKQLARSVVGYKKDIAMTKAQMTQMVQAHEHELTEQRVAIHQLQGETQGLQSCIRQLKYENAETRGEVSTMQQRVKQLEKELAELKLGRSS